MAALAFPELKVEIEAVAVVNTASIVRRHEVTETGQCLFARTPEIETEFVTRTRSRYLDFKPYRETQWQLAGERLAARRGAQA